MTCEDWNHSLAGRSLRRIGAHRYLLLKEGFRFRCSCKCRYCCSCVRQSERRLYSQVLAPFNHLPPSCHVLVARIQLMDVVGVVRVDEIVINLISGCLAGGLWTVRRPLFNGQRGVVSGTLRHGPMLVRIGGIVCS